MLWYWGGAIVPFFTEHFEFLGPTVTLSEPGRRVRTAFAWPNILHGKRSCAQIEPRQEAFICWTSVTVARNGRFALGCLIEHTRPVGAELQPKRLSAPADLTDVRMPFRGYFIQCTVESDMVMCSFTFSCYISSQLRRSMNGAETEERTRRSDLHRISHC